VRQNKYTDNETPLGLHVLGVVGLIAATCYIAFQVGSPITVKKRTAPDCSLCHSRQVTDEKKIVAYFVKKKVSNPVKKAKAVTRHNGDQKLLAAIIATDMPHPKTDKERKMYADRLIKELEELR